MEDTSPTLDMPRVRYDTRRHKPGRVQREVSWFLGNFALRALLYLALFALLWLMIYLKDPDMAYALVSGGKIEFWCNRPADEAFHMECW